MLVVAVAAAAVLVPSAHAAGGINPQIAGLQVALRSWGLYAGPIDGISGPLTAAGLHTFQRRHKLPVGVANVRTRVALGPLGHPLFGSRLLKRGDFGWDVSVLQFVLTRDGLYHGALDGYLDASTQAALRHFQSHARLQVDGIAGRRTLASLAVRAHVPVRIVPVAERWAVYVVRSGDSLTSIARRFGTTIRTLAQANHLTVSHVLLIGRHLRIPETKPSTAEPVTAPSDVRALLDAWAAREGVDPTLVRALAWMESGYQTTLVSSAGARGVLQMIPSTRRYVERVLLHRHLPNSVDGNIEAGVVLLKHLLGVFDGNESLALAGWYQGERAVRTRGVYAVTRPFVADVLALRARV